MQTTFRQYMTCKVLGGVNGESVTGRRELTLSSPAEVCAVHQRPLLF